MLRSVRLAARAVLVHRDRLLLVNAWPEAKGSDLWCAPGGGVEAHASLPDNLAREVREETGLTVTVDAPCLVNEFHAPDRGFHQVEVFFRCRLAAGALSDDWQDPEGVVTCRRWVTRDEMAGMNFRPEALPKVAWMDRDAPTYDPLELLIG
ncbi:NUDIX domain-containing protein [Jannaschia pohangensis]|uniref:ADP-ribose pyrophosphatase YjhB, NUDIX family n=1 Tax=Jannaschia pohangensis TaxID=390807 RepID=A0A1I3JTJ8_9RHOB|nr:NUDIX hydrolase [Jannaschia pohangensis]SFI63420.1 ADP-ribose pyrophosphatase YjhB, NUDIX family [Jannaschia pohangensis]